MHPKSTANNFSSIALWTIQAVLALLFLFAGGMKVVLPLDVLALQIPLPGLLVRFIGAIEVLGGIGLILPALLRIRPRLTALAAGLLAIEMIVAAVFTVVMFDVAQAVLPLVVMCLAACVAYGRRTMTPQRERSRASFQLAN